MKWKRIQALFLAVIMIFTMTANMTPAFAVDSDQDPSLCPHHTEHIDCSYHEGSAGSPCNHVHDADCEYVEAKEGVACDKGCSTDIDGDGMIDHGEGCAYQPAVEGHACMHVHDEDCGYKAPVEPVECDYVCPICDCICTSLCEDGAINMNCPVCSENHTDCTFTTVDVSLTFNSDYAQWGTDGGALLTIAGNISGKKVTQAQIAVSLSDEEIAMLDISGLTNISLNGNQLIFTLVNDETTGNVPMDCVIPVKADSLSVLDITKDDIQVSILPEEYQTSPYVNLNLTGDKIIFVEKLPADNVYGSGTSYSAQVEDLTVHYVDQNGAAAVRQETAPDFALYYQVNGESAAALQEENLPFGLDEIPEISTTAGTDTWTGQVKDASTLPSTVLALQDGKYVETEVSWFLKPSYPDDYYENAGRLVEITDDNAGDYPAGLGRGWYFIGGMEPFPDDVVAVEEYVPELEHDVYWADNANSKGMRPSDLGGYYELQFALDGSSDYKTLTEDNLAQLGLESIPKPTTSQQGGKWQFSWQDSLPGKVSYSDSTGTGSTLIRDVSWRVVFNRAPESYAMVEVTSENAGDYPSVHNQYGTYYVLETSLTFNARIYQGDSEYDVEDIWEAFFDQFYMDASYTGDRHQYFKLADLRDEGYDKPVENPDDPSLISVTFTNLWRYNLDNTRINYSIREGTPGDNIDYRLTGVSGLDDGDYFSVNYDNSKVPGFGSEVTAVYSGGLLKLTLTGTMEYHATKVWLDDGEAERPAVTMELWRYRSGQSYKAASLVRNARGEHYVLDLSSVHQNPDGTYSVDFADNLPKYDPEGYRYRYGVREYLSGTNADRYEQVFGVVEVDGSVTDTLPEYSPRNANDTFLYNGGTLSNRLKGTVPVTVTKDWKAASFQSEFDDVMVELRLQSRIKGQDAEWEDTEYTYQMFGFMEENLTATHIVNYPKYDKWGRELEYQWVEEAVWQGGTVKSGVYTGGHEVPSSINADGSRSFTLEQNGRKIIYKGSCGASGDDSQEDCTVITNSIANVIDYDVTKEFATPWNNEDYSDSYTFSLFRATSGSDMERYATFTIDKDTENDSPDITKYIEDSANLSIEQIGEWHVIIHGLPEFDADGQQYEYLLMEADGSPDNITTEQDDDGNYASVVTNAPGSGNIILVRKEWVDESDSRHRLPVEITVYDKDTNNQIGEPVVLGTNTWYELVGIGEHEPDEVYILETKVGDTEVENAENADGKPIPPTYEGTGTKTAVWFSTQYHDYEATYSYDEDFGASGGAYEGMHCYTVTNRRLGRIDLTVTKNWVDGNGEMREQLQSALQEAELNLAVKLEFMSQPSLGLAGVYEISSSGFGNETKGDTVTISSGNPTEIKDNLGNAVDSIQLLNLTMPEQTLHFWHLPKYDGNGASVRYDIKEIIVDGNGDEVTDLTGYADVARVWREYRQTSQAGPYVVGQNHALDTQEFNLTNKLDNTTDVSWYTLWLDDFDYREGSRPDIYLNIYARVHNADGSTRTQLVTRNYRWEFKKYEDDSEISQENFWKCTIESLPKYDDLGYEIDYFATIHSVVSTGDFDYLPITYAPDEAKNDDDVFATSAGMFGDDAYKGLIENVSDDPDADHYALMSGNTFVNKIYSTITYSGEKLWTNLPDGYPLVDLPSVTFSLSRSIKGGATESNIATMTISGDDWQNLKVSGHYVFAFGHTGVNMPASSFDEEVVPTGESLLPKFDDKGRLYTYTLTETINWDDTDAGNAGVGEGIFNLSGSGQTFTNSYNKTGDGQLSVRKYLNVPAGQKVYPAVKFILTRSYTTNSEELSEPERIATVTWKAESVKTEADEKHASAGSMVTVDHTFHFKDLPVYAPNGSEYIYTITEDTSQLGGFVTWAAEGEVYADQVKSYGSKTNAVTGLVADTNPDIDATFFNEPETNPAPIRLTGGKLWTDLNDDFRPEDPSQGLTVTLERRANAQTGQNNAIYWEKVDIRGKITWGIDSENSDRWVYTVTDLERYAPNGMPWIYRITEKPVRYYTAGNGGVASQKEQNNETGNIIMNDLTNSMLTNTFFKKTWVDSDGKVITKNLLGNGIELEVRYELQVRAQAQTGSAEWSSWQSADVYFMNDPLLGTRQYNGAIRAALGDSAWTQSYRGTGDSFNRLPLYMEDSTGTVYALEYRVVETDVKVYRTGENDPLLTQTYTAPLDNGSNPYAYTVGGGTNLFVPYYGNSKDSQANNTTTHKNRMETTEITVAKEWRGDHNEVYETRPKSTVTRYDWEVTLVVLRSTDGGHYYDPNPVETVTLYGTNAEKDNRKTATVRGLPAFLFDAEGNLQPCTYRVMELQSRETTPAGADRKQLEEGESFHGSYTVTYSPDRLTAINTLNTTDFQATKVWNDTEQTHSDVTLELKYLKEGGDPENPMDYLSFVPAAKVKLGDGEAKENPGGLLYYAEDDWTAVWKEVPTCIVGSELNDVTNHTVYKVFETVTGNYIVENEMVGNTVTITNTPSNTLSVTKHWLGVSDTQEVTVVLYRKTAVNPTMEQVDTAVLTADMNWSYTFDPQPKYDPDGNAYEYWVEETQIGGQDVAQVAESGGYAISYGGSSEDGFHIYNHKLDTVYVIKDWADVSDSENRPLDLELTLERTTVANPSDNDWQPVDDVKYTWEKDGDQWTTSFAGLPKYDIESGKAYTYRVTETVPEGYKQEIISSDANTFHFKNTRSELIDIPVQKIWADNANNLGYRPGSITVELYANGQPTGQILELKPGALQNLWNFLTGSDAGWSGVFEDEPKYDDTGALIAYSVMETSVSEHYRISYGEEQDGTQIITNTANGNLTVTKNVTGSGDLESDFHFTVKLSDQSLNGVYGEMTFQNGVAEVTLSHGESKTATDLPAGVTYSVVEQEANQGAYTTTSSGETGTILPGDTAQVSFVNDISRISIDVLKAWEDNDNRDGIRPNDITVVLLANGEETGKTLVLNEESRWTGSFTDLDEFKDGEKIIYTVKEIPVDGYETVISGNAETGFTIINTHTPTPSSPPTDDPPQTGDNNNIYLWWIMFLAGLIGIVVTYITFRRSKRDRKS
ncbi:MAG: Cna B-type domain-containing protein [Candidatus Alectryocaccobium sp.]|nr:Cna B-type domain-containing protein [Candidatus Alectryocaccobium sp.]